MKTDRVFKKNFETEERGLRKLHKEELQYLCSSSNISRAKNGLWVGLALTHMGVVK
jgi:hypothetical protein